MPTLYIISSEIEKHKKECKNKIIVLYTNQPSHEYLDIGLSHKDGN